MQWFTSGGFQHGAADDAGVLTVEVGATFGSGVRNAGKSLGDIAPNQQLLILVGDVVGSEYALIQPLPHFALVALVGD